MADKRATARTTAAASQPTFAPQYVKIEQALRERIAQLEPDEPLPSDAELCAEFGVSRMTARNAVHRLVEEGLVYRLPGRGTFVAEYGSHRKASDLVSFTEEMKRLGRQPSSIVIEKRVRKPTELERRRLQLAASAKVVALRRLRLADGTPIAVEDTVLPDSTAEVVLAADLEHGSLHETLRRSGFRLARGRGTVVATRASAEDARLLKVGRGTPLLVERRVILNTDGVPLEATESRYPGERYALDVAFDVEQPR